MEIKDETVTAGIADDGTAYVAEIDATYEHTLADGTHVESEIITTANPDDPTDIEGHMFLKETAPDGTETVKEYITNDEGTFQVEEESALESFVEDTFGIEIDDNLTRVDPTTGEPIEDDATAETDKTETADVYQPAPESFEADSDLETTDSDFTIGEENFAPIENEENEEFAVEETYQMDDSYDSSTDSEYTPPDVSYDSTVDPTFETSDTTDSTFEATGDSSIDTASTETSDTDAAELAEQEAHAQAATDAQNAADEFVASGDYAAAAEARETAENESWEAGDSSMLGASDSSDLSAAADRQEEAAYYEQQEAEHAQAGDYEAAKEDAQNAAYSTGDADFLAGGDDHTGQADSEVANMDNAIWHEELAEDRVDDAVWHAEMGNDDAAASSLEAAAYEQETADDFGDQGEHGAIGADYDPSSDVESGGSYESTYDSYDASATETDTSYDSDMDASYDTGMDTSMDTSYDSGMDMSYDAGTYDSGTDDY